MNPIKDNLRVLNSLDVYYSFKGYMNLILNSVVNHSCSPESCYEGIFNAIFWRKKMDRINIMI